MEDTVVDADTFDPGFISEPVKNGKKPRTPARTLVKKLAEVQACVDRVEKKATADMGSFSFAYVEEHQILEALRGELASRHVMLIPEITDVSKVGQETTIKMAFTFRDGDNGETITSQWASHAADPRDFGLSKAVTAGVKYFLLKTFLLPTWERPEDAHGVKTKKPIAGDIENTFNRDRVTPVEDNAPPAPDDPGHQPQEGSAKLISDKQGKRLYAIMMSKGRDPQDVSDYIKATYNYSHSSEIERKDYDAICTWVEGKEDD
jgi:hypothetical protein